MAVWEGGGEGELIRACVFWVCKDGEGDRDKMPEARAGLPRERSTVSRVRSILRRERVRISCFLGLLMSVHRRRVGQRWGSLGRPLAAVGLLEDAFVVAGLAPLARGAVLGADALHLEASTYRACPCAAGVTELPGKTEREGDIP